MVTTKKKKLDYVGQSRLTRNGQVTIPAEIRRDLGAGAGDAIEFYRDKTGEISLRTRVTAADLAGSFRAPEGITVTELMRKMDDTPMVRTSYQKVEGDDNSR